MTDPIDALKNADPGRSVASPDDHWRTREKIIVEAATGPDRAGRWWRLMPSVAIGSAFALGCGLIVSSVFTGSGLPTIALANGSGNLAATSSAGRSLDAMWMGNFVFSLAEGVDIAAGSADVWRWSQPSREDFVALMKRLGIDGTINKLPGDQGGGWSVPAENAAYPDAIALSASKNGNWYWWNGDSSASIAVGECVAPVDPSGAPDVSKECVYEAPPPAKNLPTDAEARKMAQPLLSLGGDYKVTDIWRDDWSVFLSAIYVLPDGTLTGQYAGVGFGDGGVITNASGQLGSLERVGRYPTVSARDAVARLSSGVYAQARGGYGVEDAIAPAVAGVVAGDSGSGGGSSGGSNSSSVSSGATTQDTVVPEPVPTDPTVISEPPIEIPDVKINLTKVKMSYSTMWGEDNYIWVVPSYEYTDSEGGTWTAIAVADRYLEGGPVPETTTTVETPVETTLPEEVTTIPEDPVTESTTTQPGSSGSTP